MLIERTSGGAVDHDWAPTIAAPAPRDTWRELVAADPSGLVSQAPEWIDVLCRAGYEDVSRLYRCADGRRMLLPLVRHRNALPRALEPLASLPAAWGMGGLLGDTAPTAGDVALVARDLARLPAVQVTVRPNPLHAPAWLEATRGTGVIATPRRAHVLDLAGGPDEVWNRRFASSARRGVRKAQANDVEIRVDGLGLLSDFRTLFDLSVERWAAQQHEPVLLAKLRCTAATRRPSSSTSPKRCRSACACGWPTTTARRSAGLIVLAGRQRELHPRRHGHRARRVAARERAAALVGDPGRMCGGLPSLPPR